MSLVERLATYKGDFRAEALAPLLALLERVKRARIREAAELIDLHETLLFLRAHPANAQVLKAADEILRSFGGRVKSLDRADFEYAEVSGIAGTGLSTNFSYPFAKSLAARHSDCIHVDWDRYQHTERLGSTLARLIPRAFEDWAIAPHPDWRAWFERAKCTLRHLIDSVTPEVYDLFELPLRWEMDDSPASRTLARVPRREVFYHTGPLLARKNVSIAAEFSKPRIAVQKLQTAPARAILDVVIDASAVRYRELYGFLYPDVANIFHADLGRGIDFFYFGVSRRFRLPRRAYMSGMYFKNGVPMGYIETMELNGRMEVGFNLYYTFRQGETAWLYARLLKLLRERLKATSFVIDPYQLGHENEEAIEAGAFWFYYKLGFRPEQPGVLALAEREASKIAARPAYRSSPRTLKKLAASEMIYRCELKC